MKRGSFLKSLGALIVGVPLAQKIELPKDKNGFYIETDRLPVRYPAKEDIKAIKYNPEGWREYMPAPMAPMTAISSMTSDFYSIPKNHPYLYDKEKRYSG